jgi:hypothetical protein
MTFWNHEAVVDESFLFAQDENRDLEIVPVFCNMQPLEFRNYLPFTMLLVCNLFQLLNQ